MLHWLRTEVDNSGPGVFKFRWELPIDCLADAECMDEFVRAPSAAMTIPVGYTVGASSSRASAAGAAAWDAALSDPPAILFDNLRIVYPNRQKGMEPKVAVKNLSLAIGTGEVFGFLGPNGAGKTSSMNALLGFLKPGGGSAQIFGLDTQNPESRLRVGYLPELTYCYKFLTGEELLRFYAKLFSIPRDVAGRRIETLIKLVELGEAARRPIRTYSKGMQQRVGLAQALINDPDLLVLDEPTSGLDPVGRMKVRSIIQRLKDDGKTVFFSSHELGEVETVCDRVSILSGGELKVVGSVADLMAEHQCNLEQIFLKVIGFEPGECPPLKEEA